MRIPSRKPGLCSSGFLCFLLLVSQCLAPLLPAAHAQPAMLLPTTTLTLKQRNILVELAATEASRTRGLMFRTSLPPDQGMLFVFDGPYTGCFWMRNTLIPLSIAFIDDDGQIINILDMEPHSLEQRCPERVAHYALEMPKGWFHEAGVRSGDKITGLPGLSQDEPAAQPR